ncbi:hypothetical protein [Microcystis sp. M061S2]|uniref:hypothetical protein n=1 Tax=Microcystis sp. M061S2 TaxID=2771171 RepID=UPI00258B7136|nr:hypothetical protein [Microcystis sp. M061S2]MCA2655977.1 hypothetical protein [Microcystis sp. M061S2]
MNLFFWVVEAAYGFLSELPTRYRMRGITVLVSYLLLAGALLVGMFFWPFILKLGLSLPLLFRGNFNAASFVWSVSDMKASYLDTVLYVWGGYCGLVYGSYFCQYWENLLELRQEWLYAYGMYPKARKWMPWELEEIPLWSSLYTLVHLILGTVSLLVISGTLSYVLRTTFKVTFQFSFQLTTVMLVAIVIYQFLASPGFNTAFVQQIASFICRDVHLKRDIKCAQRNIALVQLRGEAGEE